VDDGFGDAAEVSTIVGDVSCTIGDTLGDELITDGVDTLRGEICEKFLTPTATINEKNATITTAIGIIIT
jgi:hypothetical protein